MHFTNVFELTNELLRMNHCIKEQYEQIKLSKKQADFYEEIKPFVDKVKELCEQWQKEVNRWINVTHPEGIHTIQIEHTVENIQEVSIRSFYPTTSRVEILNYIRSNEFVLKNILSRLSN